MINQARSLILNDVAVNRPELGTFGEEYVPESYKKLDYSGTLQRIRDTLLGTAGDPLYENYRLAQYMGILHSNQYTEELVLSLDNRYTYRPFDKSFMDFDFSVSVDEIDSKGMQLTTSGEPVVSEASGKATYRWVVKSEIGPTLEVKEVSKRQAKSYDITITGETASPVELENGVILQLNVPLGSWKTGAGWIVTSMARPTQDLGLVIGSINDLGAGTTYSLLNGVPSTFKTLWYEGISLVDQLGGLLGAFVYQAEEVRVNV